MFHTLLLQIENDQMLALSLSIADERHPQLTQEEVDRRLAEQLQQTEYQ